MSLYILSSRVQVTPANLKLLHGYITFFMIKSSISASCKILVSHFVLIVTRRNILSHVKLSRTPNIVKSLGLSLAERLSMSFPGQLLNGTILSVSYRICLRWTTLIFDGPMDATAYQIKLTSPHLLYKLPMTAWQISNSWRRSYNQLLMLLGRMVSPSVKWSIFSMEWHRVPRTFSTWNHHVSAWFKGIFGHCSLGNSCTAGQP